MPSLTESTPSWIDEPLLAALAARAEEADANPSWPVASWQLVGQSGAWGWNIPARFGGSGLDRVAQLEGSEQLASACLTTAFILSQREAALRWLLQARENVQAEVLPRLARGELFVTVGLSQLTTSRQHRKPSLQAQILGDREHPSSIRLDGEIPWVTGADQADLIVTGAVLEDGRQIILILPTRQVGVTIDAPLPLAALAGSRTALVHCDGVEVPAEYLVAGPGQQLVGSGGGLETSCLAVGLTRSAVSWLEQECQRRPDLQPATLRLAEALQKARTRLHELARSSPSPQDVLALRVECTRLVLRATQASLAVAKGTGFVVPHPVQRWTGQARFFLVWSCPQSVASALLDDLTR
jgi:alkylation response protein AidB-like acyl-CoA dehydrogenase